MDRRLKGFHQEFFFGVCFLSEFALYFRTQKLMKEKWVNLLSIAGENGMTSLEEEDDREKKVKKDIKEPESKRSKSDSGGGIAVTMQFSGLCIGFFVQRS